MPASRLSTPARSSSPRENLRVDAISRRGSILVRSWFDFPGGGKNCPNSREFGQFSALMGEIDNYGVIQAGGGWGSDGGHFNGRKFPIVFAGAMLGDPAMTAPAVIACP